MISLKPLFNDPSVKVYPYIDELNRFCVSILWPMAVDCRLQNVDLVLKGKRWYMKEVEPDGSFVYTKLSKWCALSEEAEYARKRVMKGKEENVIE